MYYIINNTAFQTALELIQTEGVTELDKAKNKSQHIDHQSEQMSDISRNSRKTVEDLEKAAEYSKTQAKDSREKAQNASDLARNSIELQRSVGEQLKTKLVPDFPKEKKKLESLKKLTTESLNKAESVYEDALTLFANISAVQVPDIDLEPIKNSAKDLDKDVSQVLDELDEGIGKNSDMLMNFETNLEYSDILIKR